MIGIYCRHNHRAPGGGLCAECLALLDYASARLERCPKGAAKTSCRRCEIHCYQPLQRQHIRAVMRHAGPRMLFLYPVDAIRHLISEL